ncbi:MAG TPA: RNA polymerase sigma factor [Gemmatales bacterium]|nr:RNA polymerase sigma factor [Gemmatales bacterium]
MPANATPLSLLERLRHTPDEEAWQRFAGIYEPLLKKWLKAHAHSQGDTDDIVQDVLLTVFRKLGEFEHNGQTGAFRAWLRITAINRLRLLWREKRPALESDHQVFFGKLDLLADPHSDLSQRWDQEHDAHVAGQLLFQMEQEFAPATWHAFRRQVVEGASAKETSQEMGLSVNAVLIAKSRIMKRLRQLSLGLLE